MKRPASVNGFTIIELLIASAVFSIVLVMLVAVFIQIGRIYYKGVNISSTQDATRTALQDIGSDITFAQNAPANFSAAGTSSSSFCVGAHRYTYYLGKQVGTDNPAGLYREDLGGCPPLAQTPVNFAKANQLFGNGMQLNEIDINCSNAHCTTHMHVVFYSGGSSSGLFGSASGYNPAFQAKDAQCTGSLTGSQYCATADFENTVLQRT